MEKGTTLGRLGLAILVALAILAFWAWRIHNGGGREQSAVKLVTVRAVTWKSLDRLAKVAQPAPTVPDDHARHVRIGYFLGGLGLAVLAIMVIWPHCERLRRLARTAKPTTGSVLRAIDADYKNAELSLPGQTRRRIST